MTAADQAEADRRFMRLALALGRRNLGRTWPNPSVGAVIVSDGRILGQGLTAIGGRPHGEPQALAMAGAAARGATLYVGLEPCSHHGRSPPCTDAILASGIARVVSAMEDPDERVSGRGHALLREAGIAVETGVLREAASRDHRGHVSRVTRGRPSLHLKLAQTADGFAASWTAERLLITGAVANDAVHLWRAHADAILIGSGTARADDPALTVRLPGMTAWSPTRIVLDSQLRLNPLSRLASGAREIPTLVVTTRTAPTHAKRTLLSRGVDVLTVASDAHGRVDLHAALAALAERGFTRLGCEGGPQLADALAAADLVDRLTLITGPTHLGSRGGLRAVGSHLAQRLSDGHLREVETERLGPDIATTYERTADPCSPA